MIIPLILENIPKMFSRSQGIPCVNRVYIGRGAADRRDFNCFLRAKRASAGFGWEIAADRRAFNCFLRAKRASADFGWGRRGREMEREQSVRRA